MAYELLPRPDRVDQLVEFATDVEKAWAGGERRVRLRQKPRQVFEVQFTLEDDVAVRKLRADLFSGTENTFKLGVWPDAVYMTAAAAAASSTLVGDFSLSDVAVGDQVAVVSPDEATSEVRVVATVSSTQVTLTTTLANAYPAGSSVVPVEDVTVGDPSGYRRHTVNASVVSARCRVQVQKSLGGAGAPVPTWYRGLRVLTYRPLNDDLEAVEFESRVRVVDFGQKFTTYGAQAFADTAYPRRFLVPARSDLQWWKAFLTAQRGRQRAFYAPTWRDDLLLHVQPSVGAATIVVKDVPNYATQYASSLAHDDLQINTDAGVIYREVTASVDNLDGTVTLTLSPALPATAAGSTIRNISFLELCRLGSDEVVIHHLFGQQAVVELSTRTVQEVPDRQTMQTHSLDLERDSSQSASITDAAQNGALDVTGTITVELWVKWESLPTPGNFQAMMSKFLAAGDQRSFTFWVENVAGTYYLELIIYGNGIDAHYSRAAFSPVVGTWTHVVASWDPAAGTTPADEFRYYVDTVLKSSVTVADSDPSGIFSGTAPFEVGEMQGADGVDGLVADERLWNIVRTQAQIVGSWKDHIESDSPGLAGHWYKKNDHNDRTANANHLTPNGSPVFSTDVPYGVLL